MYTLTILNEKGGVAKTTTAVNLAGALAKRDWKVLLLEFDSQALGSQWLGVTKIETIGDDYGSKLRDAILDKTPLKNLIHHTPFELT